MDLIPLIDALTRPAAYPHPVEIVEVRQTHISVVFLAGPFVYKLKKPVNLGFLDFTTMGKRRHFCEEEVRLNRRLAPEVYHGVVPATQGKNGVQIEGDGVILEWLVKMERLPEGASLLGHLRRGEFDRRLVTRLAERIADFHARADRGAHIASFGRFEVVARNARENFEQARPQIGNTLSREVFERLRAATNKTLESLRPLMESRALGGMPCDCHGDLHLDHVYSFPDRPPPNDLIAIDCIEFNERFRYGDPVADAAFLFMDLLFHDRRDLANAFADAYFRVSADVDGRTLLPFYTAYRAAIRGKVEGFELEEKEIPEAERVAARERARAHWLLALGELEEPARRPALVLIGGLPGTGKSTLARGLAECCGFSVIRSDVVRKELAGLAPESSARDAPDQGIYAPEMTARTYAECLRRAGEELFKGSRIIVDAKFAAEEHRRTFLDRARQLGVRAFFLVCHASPEVVRDRILHRHGDASDADLSIHEYAARHWEDPGSQTELVVHNISADGGTDQTLAQAVEVLRQAGLMS